ncbi:SpoIIE family protein phosphatase [Glycomyces sp. YM15]|uniref:PP2C family protein-serine/threonine phosphatase n=1 Tax=Glycomyces sp. YM15 TaxID=2800446 RepID=UPI0027DC225C|nr:SpoIIE family protein phosphatase [Glycomyces sp. YM15]
MAHGIADLDYAAFFELTPSPSVVLDPDLVIVEVNHAYRKATGRTREDLLGRHLFDAFPGNPADQESDGVRNLSASLQRVIESREPDTMALQKYDIAITGRPGVHEERWWLPTNTPILGPDRALKSILIRMDDVTPLVNALSSGDRPPARTSIEGDGLGAELYTRARELQLLNQGLRSAHDREHEVAVTLQKTMLMTPDLQHHDGVAVRYLPAVETLNVCGDWYDFIDLPGDRVVLTIGDVVGHGLEAAAVMGMMRSALNAAIRTSERPAQALEVLGLYARSLEGAVNTTAANAMVDPDSRVITYSNAGHPPPVLVRANGECELLNQIVDPPLGTRPRHVPRSQAGHVYTPGDTLVLYTDGLIERRGEDIDEGLARLVATLGRHGAHSPERMADALLSNLVVAGGARDDIALIIFRL